MPAASPLSQEILRNRARYLAQAARILREHADAEDVIQEAMLIACGGGRGCAAAEAPERYACRMIRNLALDALRRRGARGRLLAEPAAEDLPAAPACRADRAFEGCEALRLVARALAALPERSRRILLAHRLDERAQNAIAREEGLSPARIHALIREADARLRAALDPAQVSAQGAAAERAPAASRRPPCATAPRAAAARPAAPRQDASGPAQSGPGASGRGASRRAAPCARH